MSKPPKGLPAQLAQLVQEHGDFEFEGFTWLRCNLESLAEHLGKHRNTIRNAIGKPPFHHITRNTKEDGRHILLKIGSEPTETDHVFVLRSTWAKGLIYFNAALASQLTLKVMYLKSVKANPSTYDRLLHRISQAEESAKDLEKLKAGEKLSAHVPAPVMGQLRGMVKALGTDAPGALACIITFEGWQTFTAYLKAEGLLTRHYHWPQPKLINDHPGTGLQVYLDMMQANAKIDPAESDRLLAKIAALTPPEGTPA